MKSTKVTKVTKVLKLQQRLIESVDRFSTLLNYPKEKVPKMVRQKAFLRRLRICFILAYEYYDCVAPLPEDKVTPLEQGVDLFVAHGVLPKEDKQAFLTLGEVFASLCWSAATQKPNEELIMTEIPLVYNYLRRMVDSFVMPEQESRQDTPQELMH